MLYIVDDVHGKAEGFQLAFPHELQRPRCFAGGFQLGKSDAPVTAGRGWRKQDDPVRHAIKPGAYPLGAKAAHALHSFHQAAFDCFLSHSVLLMRNKWNNRNGFLL